MNAVSIEKDHASVEAELAAFVYHEAMLLDTGRYDEWLALFAESGLYWMPLSADQPPGDDTPSLLYEDLVLLRLRIQRYANPRAHSLHPAVRGLRILQAPGCWLATLRKACITPERHSSTWRPRAIRKRCWPPRRITRLKADPAPCGCA